MEPGFRHRRGGSTPIRGTGDGPVSAPRFCKGLCGDHSTRVSGAMSHRAPNGHGCVLIKLDLRTRKCELQITKHHFPLISADAT